MNILRRLKFIAIILFVLLCLIIIPSSSIITKAQGAAEIQLFYTSGSELTTEDPPEGQSHTFNYGPSAMVLSKTVGRWGFGPVPKPITISGDLTSTMWADGYGTIYFENRLYVNGEYTGNIFSSGTLRLNGELQAISSTEAGVNIELETGDIFEVDVAIYTSGLRGGTVHWGSSDYPSDVLLTCDSVEFYGLGFGIDFVSQKIEINSTIVSAFGPEDIANYTLRIDGPTEPESVTEKEPEIVDGELSVSWVWDYGKDQTKYGEEYTITIEVIDNSENSWSMSAGDPIVLKEIPKLGGIEFYFIQIIVVIAVIAVIIFLIAYKLFLGKYINENIRILKKNTEYFADYKLLIVGEVLHYLSWYLLLVISLFILRTVWRGWGDILVGINYALYQSVSVVLFLSLAKNSDARGARKNLLLSLIVVGSILLFIMAWLSFIPSPVITVIIIVLFTLFVLCFYGFDNLKVVLITEYFPEHVRGKAFGFMRAIGNIGGLIGGVLSGFLFEQIGFWFCFLFGGIVLISSFFIMFRIRDVGVIEDKITITEWLQHFIAGTKQLGSRLTAWFRNVFIGMRVHTINDYLFGFRNKKQMTLLFYTTLFTLIAYGMIVPYIMVFLNEARGESATVLSMVYTIFGIAIFLPINQVAAGWLCDKYGARKVYVGAIFAYIGLWGVFNLTIPLTTSNVLIMAVFIFPVWPFLWIGFKMFVADITPRSERVRGVTAIRLALGIGIVIGSIGGGVMLYFLSYETVFLIAMIFTFIAAAFAIILLRITGEVERAQTTFTAVDG
jgi:predicted MFS family arabinose efflux permease